MYSVFTYKSVVSTNTVALEHAAAGAVHGTGILAENQTAGRGRLGKAWHSSSGQGLYCSIIVRPGISPSDYPKLTLVAGLAVQNVVATLINGEPKLKWPNDIFVNGRKCCGILAESGNLMGESPYGVIGIGINILQQRSFFPAELAESATSLVAEGASPIMPLELFELVRSAVLFRVRQMEEEGFAGLLEEWKKHDFLLGKEMECVSSDGKIVRGLALGPDADGLLHVRGDNGSIYQVLSGDVRLAK